MGPTALLRTVSQILAQPFFPRIRLHTRDLFVAFGRQDGVRGTNGRPRKRVARHGSHSRLIANDRAREVEPSALRLIGVVNDAARVLVSNRTLREPDDGLREMRRVGWTSALVVHNP